jgi:hypothetical protein
VDRYACAVASAASIDFRAASWRMYQDVESTAGAGGEA